MNIRVGDAFTLVVGCLLSLELILVVRVKDALMSVYILFLLVFFSLCVILFVLVVMVVMMFVMLMMLVRRLFSRTSPVVVVRMMVLAVVPEVDIRIHLLAVVDLELHFEAVLGVHGLDGDVVHVAFLCVDFEVGFLRLLQERLR